MIENEFVFFKEVIELIQSAKKYVSTTINNTIVITHFLTGRLIVENEQQGQARATYGQNILKELSKRLTNEFGKGYSVYSLERMRKFYLVYKEQIPSIFLHEISRLSENTISAAVLRKLENPFQLTWSHYLELIKIENINERKFYEIECLQNKWSIRELERQYNSSLYERLALSRDKDKILELSKMGQVITKPMDTIKEPFILEFLELDEQSSYSESELETAIIDKLGKFLLELGKGFLFVGRQQRITLEDDHFYVDLVFYNRFLRCFVLIDLKIGKLKHQDIGQMQMYVNYYDQYIKSEDETPSIGIILCKQKNETLVKITLPKDNEQIFTSRYQMVLPSKEELQNLLKENN